MQSKRDYLVGLGLAKPGRGKFSNAGKEAIAKAEAGGMKFSDVSTGPIVSKPAPAVKSEPVQSDGNSNYLFPDEYRYPESEYRAFVFNDGKRKPVSLRECCNTCRVSLVNHACENPTIHGNVAVKIERV